MEPEEGCFCPEGRHIEWDYACYPNAVEVVARFQILMGWLCRTPRCVYPISAVQSALALFRGDQTVSGSGQIVFSGLGSNRIYSRNNETLTLGPILP